MTPRKWLHSAVALVLIGAAMTVAAAGASGMPAAKTFTDPTGDSSGAPDITTIAMSDDRSTGTITVAVTATGFPQGGESDVVLWLDTDKNPDTGDPEDGTDYALAAGLDEDGYWWDVGKWTGDWHSAPPTPTIDFNLAGDVRTWTLNKSDLGGTSGFDFYAVSSLWALGDTDYGQDGPTDWAPDGEDDWWTYDLSTAAPPTPAVVTPVIGKAIAIPAQPRAGRRFTLGFPVTRSDTGTPLKKGTMVCTARVAGKVVRHVHVFQAGKAIVTLTIPKTAKGKLLKITARVTADKTATKVFTYKIR